MADSIIPKPLEALPREVLTEAGIHLVTQVTRNDLVRTMLDQAFEERFERNEVGSGMRDQSILSLSGITANLPVGHELINELDEGLSRLSVVRFRPSIYEIQRDVADESIVEDFHYDSNYATLTVAERSPSWFLVDDQDPGRYCYQEGSDDFRALVYTGAIDPEHIYQLSDGSEMATLHEKTTVHCKPPQSGDRTALLIRGQIARENV